MESIFEKGIKNYSFVKDKIYKSQFYYKLRKIIEEIRYEKSIRNIEESGASA